MKECPKCGYRDPPEWRNSRFDFNAEYCRFDNAPKEANHIVEALKDKANFEPFAEGAYIFYRRGTRGIYLYRVLKEDFRVPRERKRHKNDPQQKKLA